MVDPGKVPVVVNVSWPFPAHVSLVAATVRVKSCNWAETENVVNSRTQKPIQNVGFIFNKLKYLLKFDE